MTQPNSTDGAQGPQQKDKAPPAKSDRSAWVMILIAAVLLYVGGHFDNAQLIGQHKLLVAAPGRPMKEFDKTVILLTGHTRTAAYGIIINRPGAKGGIGDGGPLEKDKDKIFALHSLDVVLPETQQMTDIGLGYLEGKAAIDKLNSATTKPSWYIVVRGYAGWGQGQIEQEIHDGVWELVEFDKNTVTTTPPAKLWEAARKLPQIELTH
jgi:putative transcriptional regulator